MRNTTLCYIEKDGQYLMLHRVKKINDVNKDKWIGIGGGFEADESPEECIRREAIEETGLTLGDLKLRSVTKINYMILTFGRVTKFSLKRSRMSATFSH